MGALDLVMGIGKGALGAVKKTAPFFSKADVVLDELQRGKGTGNEFLTELVKKGAKPTELKERGIERALKDRPKMTKAEVKKVFEEKAPPKIQEKVLRNESPNYDDFLEAKAQEEYGVDWWELKKHEKARIEKMFEELPTTKYEQYKTPGGENYREILLKLPKRSLTNEERWELDLYKRDLQRVGGFTPEKQARFEELKAKEAASIPDYISSHYREDPNLLAHIRVQDFKTPEGKKVLLVDEIQSDWHQAGRKKGYDTPEKRAEQQAKLDQILNLRQSLLTKQKELEDMALPYTSQGKDAPANIVGEWSSVSNKLNELQAAQNRLGREFGTGNLVPDAPFKKNWHELAMKRVLDYAAENGYDTVAITPGAEQAKRYDLSKNLESIQLVSPNKESLQDSIFNGYSKDGRVVNRLINTPKELSELVGKEVAEKLIQQQFVKGKEGNAGSFIRRLENQDLTIGGEGMKGFYDKILPDYLNTFGKQYGSGVGEIDLITKPEKSVPQIAAPGLGHFPEPIIEPAQTMKAWSFDITPQLREQIKTKGLPLYSKTGMGPEGLAAGTGAATIGAEALTGEDEQQVQNPVHFTENPDAMQLELMQRN